MVLGSGNAVVSQLFCGRRVLGFGDENAGRPSLVVKLCRFASAPRLAATQDFHGVCLMERVGNYQKGRHPGQDRLSKEIRSSPCRQEKQNRNEQNVPVFLRHRFLRLSVNTTSEYRSFKYLKRNLSGFAPRVAVEPFATLARIFVCINCTKMKPRMNTDPCSPVVICGCIHTMV